jgi:cell division protein FtsA
MQTPLQDAENIKKMFGCAIVTRIPEANEIEVPSVGDRPPRLIQQRMLGEILEPRSRELMELLRDHLRQAGVADLLGAGLVFTGGGSRLNGLLEIAEDVMHRPIRQGYPVPIAKLPSELLEPEFGTAIGMVLYGHRARQARMNLDRGLGAKIRSLFAKQGA